MSSYTPPYQLTNTILALSTEIAAAIKEVSLCSGLSTKPHLHRANRIQSVHSSLAIEHNSLTLNQVTALLDGKRVLAPQQEVLEVQNAFRAYDLLPALNPYSIDDLLKVHRVMMEGLVFGAGTFRNQEIGVYSGNQLIHAGTPSQYVPETMQQLFDWLKNTRAHPLVSSSVFHYEFEFIHPFTDGNGRCGRLWQTLILQKWEPIFAYLPIESMILAHQEDYYVMLNAANSQGSATVFIEFMLEMILEALKNVYVEQGNSPSGFSTEERLLALLRKDASMTIPRMAEQLELSERQVRRLIASLKEKGIIKREGSSKSGRWIVTAMS